MRQSQSIAYSTLRVRGSGLCSSLYRTSSKTSTCKINPAFTIYRSFSSGLPDHEELVLPSLSPTMETGVIARWNVKEGEFIEAGSIMCEVETDKATVDYESTDDGYLAKIIKEANSGEMPVGTVIGIVVEDESDVAAFADYSPTESSSSSTPGTTTTPATPTDTSAPPKPATPVSTLNIENTVPSGSRVFASPLARKSAHEQGINISAVRGSGPNGRVIKADIDSSSVSTPQPYLSSPSSTFDSLDLTALRRTIARNTTESKQTIPHYYLTVDVEIDRLMSIRAKLNEKTQLNNENKLSVNDFIIKAAALSCREVPECNSSWQHDSIRQYHHVDINVGMSTANSGLVSPIVRDCDSIGLAAISSSVKDLAKRAGDNKLAPVDHEVGTFTISNLGMFGIKNFSAIISAPQACILAVGAGTDRLLPAFKDSDESYRTAKVMSVTLSCDHRVVDGAVGAKWLQCFKAYVEDPLTLLL